MFQFEAASQEKKVNSIPVNSETNSSDRTTSLQNITSVRVSDCGLKAAP